MQRCCTDSWVQAVMLARYQGCNVLPLQLQMVGAAAVATRAGEGEHKCKSEPGPAFVPSGR